MKNLNSEIEFEVTVAGIKLEHPLMNGAGTCKSLEGPEGVREFARSNTAAIMVGSATVEPREGNTGETYWSGEGISLNSRGLPNPGAQYYCQNLPEMVTIAHSANKPLFFSAAGFNPTEYASLSELAFQEGVDGIELDLGCPNIWEYGQPKRIACFDPQLVAEILQSVETKVGEKARIFIKLSPFSNPFSLKEIAGVIAKFKVVKAITTSNTFPNALAFTETGKTRITSGGGLAGLGGSALKSIALGQVKQLREILPKRIDIIGCGGINKGQDIIDFRRAGAPVVQIATAFFDRGFDVFTTLLTEYVAAIQSR